MNSAFELIEGIKDLDLKSEDDKNKAACLIKKMVHGEKLSVYHRMFLDLKYGPRRPRQFKKHVKYMVENWIKPKIETHEKFSERPYTKQIYGLFDWEK
jgi:hypothetical protein